MLDALNITKFYGMRPVLRDVTLHVTKGEFVAILGPNGAGKTTLLRVFATLVRPEKGQLVIDGVNAMTDAIHVRAKLGVVSHQTLVYPDLTAEENLQFYARMYGVSDKCNAGALSSDTPIDDVIRRVELQHRARDPVRTFSRGMIQRLSIARAILHNPPLLLLDEPYTGLDQVSARTLSSLLRDLALAGRTVIMTTHEFGRGLDGVTRAVILKSGKITDEIQHDITAERIEKLVN
jgi:heme exporter protein A